MGIFQFLNYLLLENMQNKLELNGLIVQINRKPIKHYYLRICQKHGHVLVSAPLRSSERAIKQLVQSKLAWLQQQILKFKALPPAEALTFNSNEVHYFLGQAYTLTRFNGKIPAKIVLTNDGVMQLYAPPNASPQYLQRVMDAWYKQEFSKLLSTLMPHWQKIIQVEANDWRIRKMKSRWGTCNPQAKRIWLNLELIKKPFACLEYVLVHELVHLLERGHNQRFYSLMSHFLPNWQECRKQLNSKLLPAASPLATQWA